MAAISELGLSQPIFLLKKYLKNSPKNYLHLGYSAVDTNKIDKGMDIIINEIKLITQKA